MPLPPGVHAGWRALHSRGTQLAIGLALPISGSEADVDKRLNRPTTGKRTAHGHKLSRV